MQVDVKSVPLSCLVGDAKGHRFYQFRAIDEHSRLRYIKAFEEHNTYSSSVFLEHLVKYFKFPIECVQTDKGIEFTNRFSSAKRDLPTLFEATALKLGIGISSFGLTMARSNAAIVKIRSVFTLIFLCRLQSPA